LKNGQMRIDVINPLALVAEREIRAAMEQGRLDNLPGPTA